MLDRIKKRNKTVKIGLVGKYVELHDAYLSVVESLNHAGYENGAVVDIDWIQASDLESYTEEEVAERLKDCDGILVPGGFGIRGIEGKIAAVKYARTHNVPLFGLCLGMQVAVIEFARNVLGYADAHSGEFVDDGKHSVIDLMPDQQGNIPMGGTMRLGAYPCKIKAGTMMEQAYQSLEVSERHRHRYEFNNKYREEFEEKGMVISGTSPDGRLVEAVEVPANRFHVAVQYHPEFKSRPNHAHPLFREFIKAALEQEEQE